MDFNIDKLADLKIAIKKNEAILSEREKANVTLETRNKDLTSTNNRLENEIEVQVKRIDEAKASNQKLIEEKEWILSQFAVDNEKVYKELREKEQNVANESQQVALRLIELDKREGKLANKETSNKKILEEARKISKETKDEANQVESKLLDLEAEKKKIAEKQKIIAEKEEALEEIKAKIEESRRKAQDEETTLLELNQANQNNLINIRATEKAITSEKERLEKLTPLFIELKKFVIENSEANEEMIQGFIEWLTSDTEVIATVSDEHTIEDKWEEIEDNTEFDIEGSTYAEMVAEAKKRGFNLKSPKKAELIELLSK